MGFDDVIALPITGDDVGGRIERQIDRIHTYYETATYFGPDRRNRNGGTPRSTGSDRGGGQFRPHRDQAQSRHGRRRHPRRVVVQTVL